MGFGISSGITVGNNLFGYYDIPTTAQFDTWEEKAGFMMDWSRGWIIAQQVPHEIYPGHHFQSFMQQQSKRPLRRYASNAPFSEGWGVYAEDLMYEMGYMRDDPPVTSCSLSEQILADCPDRRRCQLSYRENGFSGCC